MHDPRASRLKKSRACLNLGLTVLVATVVSHILEVDGGYDRKAIWAAGLGTSAAFGLLFLALAPISPENKTRFWSIAMRTHLSDFIEMATLRSMVQGAMRNVAWFFTVGGVVVMFTPRYQGWYRLIGAQLDARFVPPETLAKRAEIADAKRRHDAAPDSIETTRDYAYILLRTGQARAAQELLERTLAREPAPGEDRGAVTRLDLRVLLASVYQTLGKEAEEVPIWRAVIRERPRDGEARHNLGIALMRLGNSTEARIELKVAVDQAVDDLQRFKRDFGITPKTVGTISPALAEQLAGFKFRAGASLYQYSIATDLAGKTAEAPKHRLTAKQLGYDVSRYDRDLARVKKAADRVKKNAAR